MSGARILKGRGHCESCLADFCFCFYYYFFFTEVKKTKQKLVTLLLLLFFAVLGLRCWAGSGCGE